MKLQLTLYYALVLGTQSVDSFWPPPVDIDLKQQEVFELSDPIKDEEVQDVYDEDEMIQEHHRKALGVKPYSDELYIFHRNLKREEVKKTPVETKQIQKFAESNPDVEEAVPWKAGIVNEKGEFSEDVYYFDGEDLKESKKRKRADEETTEANYDYAHMKAEYNKLAEEAARSKETLNYTEVKEDETPKEAVETAMDLKVPKNCTEQEKLGIGLQAIECLLNDLSNPKMKNRTLERIIRITIIWMSIYLVLATFCWCQYGWCCCCFRCKVCRPREQIDEAKKFFVENPLGVYKENAETIHRYQPTYYEKYALKQLEKELARL
ncbi:unnamed protein product [Callosobruchus maculatus]|uniref:Uncharacterized protein n=1 Tax=Callosobruchus maculatus TaxID=64391 RepID=A0A653DYJ8_CALMS|nr:unnamed protein product [Callosobruchus maculatus]